MASKSNPNPWPRQPSKTTTPSSKRNTYKITKPWQRKDYRTTTPALNKKIRDIERRLAHKGAELPPKIYESTERELSGLVRERSINAAESRRYDVMKRYKMVRFVGRP
jgi:hypothetical protein